MAGIATARAVVQIAQRQSSWRLVIVSERWWAGDSDTLIRDTTWLKLIAGKAADVTGWLKQAQGGR